MSTSFRSHLALVAVLAVTLILTWIPRDVTGIKRPFLTPANPELEAAGWFSIDPDGLYHTRRVERALSEGLPVAETDPYLSYPDGARIPWPPYYDLALSLGLGPLAPEESDDIGARRAWLERTVATLPFVFGLGSAVLAVLIVWFATRGAELAARAAGALAAGATFALCRSSINYSVIGTGDHHSWVSFLDALLLGALALALGRGALRKRGTGAAWGALCGAIAGVMLGSWVAALLYVINVQLVLAWYLFRRAKEGLPGVATFGLAFHAVALAVVLPAVLSSPWREELPWMVVNLSWFHPTQLLIGALVFVPPLALGDRLGARYPWLVAGVLLFGAGGLWLADVGPARGVAEGFAWASRADAFMASILESAPLLGPRSGGLGQLFLALGYGVLVVPLAWWFLARAALRAHEHALVPFALALPPLLLQALVQRRFADALVVPMAVALGWGLVRFARGPRWLLVPGALALALLAQLPSLQLTSRQIGATTATGARDDALLGERLLYEWIRRNTPDTGDYAVLASWDRGHMLEWAADRPSVATNFGSYIGVDGYRAPARFFLEADPLKARALLKQRDVRYVLVPGSHPSEVPSMVGIVDPSLMARYMINQDGNTVTSAGWLVTMGARLLADGVQVVPPQVLNSQRSAPLGFLRLVHVSPYRQVYFRDPGTGDPLPAGFVWEHVPGATIAAHGAPGDVVRIEIDLRYEAGDHDLEFRARAVCDESGLGRLWVPYTTAEPNGDGIVTRARWTVGDLAGELTISEEAVQGGRLTELP